MSRKTIRRYFQNYEPVTGEICLPSQPVVATLDATFFRKGDGLLLARAKKKNLLWREIESEKISDYDALLTDLQNSGCRFSAFVIDGRRGVKDLILRRFPNVPLQICQFHQVAIVRRYLTSRPKLEASYELLRLVCTLKKSTQKAFEHGLVRV
jgi:hypothetical protein